MENQRNLRGPLRFQGSTNVGQEVNFGPVLFKALLSFVKSQFNNILVVLGALAAVKLYPNFLLNVSFSFLETFVVLFALFLSYLVKWVLTLCC